MVAQSPKNLELAVQVTYATACATAWLAYDTAIHWDIEMECIWRRPRSWVKWTYVFVRYCPILHGGALFTLDTKAHFSSAGCKGWIYEQLIFVELLTFVVEGILVMRLYVLYNQNKLVLWIMLTAFLAEFVMMVAALAIVLPRMTFSPDCLVASAPAIFVAYWLSSLAFETFLFLLTLIKFFQSVSNRRSYGNNSILFIFMRDGTWAFMLIFVAMLLNMLMYKLNKTPLVGMGYGWAFGCMSFAGSHVLLNLRRLGVPDTTTAATLTAIDFVPQLGMGTTGFTTRGMNTGLATTDATITHNTTTTATSATGTTTVMTIPDAYELKDIENQKDSTADLTIEVINISDISEKERD